MADIIMCLNTSCLYKKACYRFTAVPEDDVQPYAKFKVEDESGECSGFWDNFNSLETNEDKNYEES